MLTQKENNVTRCTGAYGSASSTPYSPFSIWPFSPWNFSLLPCGQGFWWFRMAPDEPTWPDKVDAPQQPSLGM